MWEVTRESIEEARKLEIRVEIWREGMERAANLERYTRIWVRRVEGFESGKRWRLEERRSRERASD